MGNFQQWSSREHSSFNEEGFDEGPIIVVESYKFSKGSSYENIRIQVYEKGSLLAAKVLKKMVSSQNWHSELKPQDESIAKYYKPIPYILFGSVLQKIKDSNYPYLT